MDGRIIQSAASTSIALTTGTGGVTGHLSIASVYSKLLSVTPVDVNGYEYFDLEFVAEALGTNSPVDIVIADAIDWGY
jgi:hypothetical protein